MTVNEIVTGRRCGSETRTGIGTGNATKSLTKIEIYTGIMTLSLYEIDFERERVIVIGAIWIKSQLLTFLLVFRT